MSHSSKYKCACSALYHYTALLKGPIMAHMPFTAAQVLSASHSYPTGFAGRKAQACASLIRLSPQIHGESPRGRGGCAAPRAGRIHPRLRHLASRIWRAPSNGCGCHRQLALRRRAQASRCTKSAVYAHEKRAGHSRSCVRCGPTHAGPTVGACCCLVALRSTVKARLCAPLRVGCA